MERGSNMNPNDNMRLELTSENQKKKILKILNLKKYIIEKIMIYI